MGQKTNDNEKNEENKDVNSSKKLGLSSSGRLELKKTIEGGTVRQSFAHGRTKSVSVEVKKVRSYKIWLVNFRYNDAGRKWIVFNQKY